MNAVLSFDVCVCAIGFHAKTQRIVKGIIVGGKFNVTKGVVRNCP
jgi:hypothetical protein